MKRTNNKDVESKELREQQNTAVKSKKKFRVSQRFIVSIMVVLSIAILSYVVLWALVRTEIVRNNRNFDKHISECADYVGYVVNRYNSDGDENKAVGEIKTMAYSLSGRILVVDTGYRVLFDSYGKDDGRYVIDDGIFDVMNGEKDGLVYDLDDVYKKIIPVINGEGYTDAVAVMAVPKEAISASQTHMMTSATYLLAIALILGLVAAFFIAKLSVRDVNSVRVKIEGMKGGSLEQMSQDGMFRETRELTKDINDIFNKAQLLEESRQEFVSNVSHELKTPITSMKVLSESLLTQDNVPAEMYREFMEDIVQEIDREAEIISDLLTLVKTDKGPDSLNRESVDMNEFMELILKRLKPLAEKRSIDLSFESFRDIHANIDKVKFTLAISNLIENGIKYNIDGGWIRVSLNADHRNFYIKVADSGVGIPEDCINHIFERFYRVDKARSRDTGGTGLGLAITKNIIILHKGTINVYSEPGKGTTFTVKIPIDLQQ